MSFDRSQRTTPNLGIPIPSDGDPTDYVTYTGAVADAVDTAVPQQIANLQAAMTVPLVSPGALDVPPLLDPPDGQIVDVNVNPAEAAIWRFRYNAAIGDPYKWICIGGTPLEAYDPTGMPFGYESWVAIPTPAILIPRPGFYRVEAKSDVQNVSGYSGVTSYLDVTRSANPTATVFDVSTGGDTAFSGTGPGIIPMVTFGRTYALPVDYLIHRQYFFGLSGMQTFNRGLRVIPLRTA
jgi:hypothetical protein